MDINEEIIINNINIKFCKHKVYDASCNDYKCDARPETNNAFEIIDYETCQKCPNCYYKQLKRKEKECEKLMEEKTNLNLIIDRLLKAGGYSEDTCNPYDFEEVYQDLEYKINQFKKYKQALEKIEEYTTKLKKLAKDDVAYHYLDTVLQIIKECKE